MNVTLDDLRRYAVARSLFAPALAAELAVMARFLGVMPPLDGSTGTGCPHLL